VRTDETVGGSKGTGPGDPSALALIGTAVGVLALSYASLVFTREAGRIALVWPANAMVVAILLRTASNRQWRVVAMGFLGILGANLLFGDPIAGAFELAACNGLEIALCTALLQRTSGGQIDLNRQSLWRQRPAQR
jgi:integral membrane sensor domain MASE1